MTEWTLDLSAVAAHLVLVAGHFLWQGAAVLAVALLATRLLAGASASARYRVQLACLALLAALPLATLVAGWPRDAIRRVPVVVAREVQPTPTVVDAEPWRMPPKPRDAAVASDAATRSWRDYAPLCVAGYAGGVALLMARLAWAVHGGMSLRRRATPLADDARLALARRAAERLGVRRFPVVAICADVLVPTVVGVLRPAILLPPAALTGLTPSQLEAVLAHELAHLRRYDHLVELAQRLIESLLFFHPAVWIVSRRLRVERELCCDELVIGANGADPRDYAASLVAVAEHAFARRAALRHVAALAAVSGRRSNLRDRIDRLLRPTAPTQVRLSRGWAFAAALAIVLLGSTASLRHGTRAAAEAPATTQAATTQPHVIHLTVTDADTGRPIPNATVAIRRDPGEDGPPTKTDDQGRLDVPMRENVAPAYVELTASAPGRATMQARWRKRNGPIELPDAFTLSLPKGIRIGGRVVDADGKSVGGARLTLSVRQDAGRDSVVVPGISYQRIDADADGQWSYDGVPDTWKALDLGAFHLQRGGWQYGFYPMNEVEASTDVAALRAGTHVLTLPPVRLITGRIVDADDKPIAKAEVGIGDDSVASNALPTVDTDADGRYAIGGLPDAPITLTFRAKGHAPELRQFQNKPDLGPIDVALQPAKTLAGRVVDPDGKPVAKAYVWVDTWRSARTLRTQLRTDADGRFEWKDAPVDEVLVSVSGDGFANLKAGVTQGRENVLQLKRPVVFRGRVIDAETKQPVAGYKTNIGLKFGASDTPTFHALDGSNAPTTRPDGTFEIVFDYPYFGRIVRVEADGYAPGDSQMVTMTDGDQSHTYELRRAAGLTGTVVDAAGKPVEGADVMIATAGNGVQLENGTVNKFNRRDVEMRTTDKAGRFRFSPQTGPFILIASGNDGYAEIEGKSLKADQPIALQPWAKVSGVAYVGRAPARNVKLQAWSQADAGKPYDPKAPRIYSTLAATTDGEGRFAIDRVPPGSWALGRYVQVSDDSWTTANAARFEATPGSVQTLKVGGNGRAVVGRVEIPAELAAREDWTVMSFDLSTKVETPPLPRPIAELQAMTPEQRQAFMASPEAKAFEKAQREAYAKQRRYPAWVRRDGTFRIEDVEPGTYQASGQINQRTPGRHGAFGEVLASVKQTELVVPAGEGDAPVELPPLSVTMRKSLAVGQVAPDFDVPTLDGKRVKLSDLRGKIVLVDFWATWCGPCVAELPHLKAAYAKFGNDPRFAFVSLSLDAKEAEPKAFVEREKLGWTQGFLGDWAQATLPAEYGVDGIPATFLIGADGKVIARGLRGEAVSTAIESALAK